MGLRDTRFPGANVAGASVEERWDDERPLDWPDARKRLFRVLAWAGAGSGQSARSRWC